MQELAGNRQEKSIDGELRFLWGTVEFIEFSSLTQVEDSQSVSSRTCPMESPTRIALTTAIERMAQGEKKALGEIYDLYGKIVYSVSFKILRNPADAEEATQDAFVALWKNASNLLGNVDRVLPWLLRTVRNRAIDRLRKSERRLPSSQVIQNDNDRPDLEPRAESNTALEEVLKSEQAETVRRSLNSLPQKQRSVIELAYFKGMSQSEIAEHLGESLGTVKSRTRYALTQLRRELEGCHVA